MASTLALTSSEIEYINPLDESHLLYHRDRLIQDLTLNYQVLQWSNIAGQVFDNYIEFQLEALSYSPGWLWSLLGAITQIHFSFKMSLPLPEWLPPIPYPTGSQKNLYMPYMPIVFAVISYIWNAVNKKINEDIKSIEEQLNLLDLNFSSSSDYQKIDSSLEETFKYWEKAIFYTNLAACMTIYTAIYSIKLRNDIAEAAHNAPPILAAMPHIQDLNPLQHFRIDIHPLGAESNNLDMCIGSY